MRAKLSVIIPTLNTLDRLAPCLAAVQSGVSAGLVRELIFADGGSSDALGPLADMLGANLVQTAPGRGTQLAAGVAASQGEWVMIVHADSVLASNWVKIISAHIANSPYAGYGKLRFECSGIMPWVVAGWANSRSRLFGLPYGDQMLILPRALYDRVGGYQAIALMEDVALARALRGQMVALDVIVRTSADRYLRRGWLRQGASNLWLLLRYLWGANPNSLARIYRA